MKKLYMNVSLCLVMGMVTTGFAQSAVKDTHDEIQQTTKAATIFREIMSAPDKAIPRGILDDADCIAVFPQVIKAAFGIGGRGGSVPTQHVLVGSEIGRDGNRGANQLRCGSVADRPTAERPSRARVV